MYKVLSAESCCCRDTQPAAEAAVIQKSPSKNLLSSFRESFISSGKQGDGATDLGEGPDIVTRETCITTSLNINNIGKAAMLHFASHSVLQLEPCQTQPVAL
jgi:hypothetical protein